MFENWGCGHDLLENNMLVEKPLFPVLQCLAEEPCPIERHEAVGNFYCSLIQRVTIVGSPINLLCNLSMNKLLCRKMRIASSCRKEQDVMHYG